MKRAARQEEILRRVQQDGSVRVRALSESLGVSQETIRRELRALETGGGILKRHGVVGLARLEEGPFETRMNEHEETKRAIGVAAAALVDPEAAIFIDGGTTSFFVARALSRVAGLTVLTNALPVALEFVRAGRSTVHLCGGSVDNDYHAAYDRVAQDAMDRYVTDLAVLSIAAIDLEHGLMDVHPGEAAIARLAIRHARRVMLVADSSKYGRRAFAKVGKIGDVDLLVTDEGLPSVYADAFAGATIIKV